MSDVQEAKDKQFARTLARGIALLQAFPPSQEFMTNGELASAMALDRATIARLTYTLVRLNLLEHDREARRYRLSPGVLRFAYPLLASLHLRQFARPAMQELASIINGTVGLGTRHHRSMVYLDAVVEFDELNPPIDRGMSIPLLASAMGQAWLAFVEPSERKKTLNMLRVREPELHARYARRAEAGIKMFCEKGYCSSFGHRLPNRLSVATPWRSRLHDHIYVFNCTVTTDDAKAQGETIAAFLGDKLVNMVRQLENTAGYLTPAVLHAKGRR